jgi:hypothetical protein
MYNIIMGSIFKAPHIPTSLLATTLMYIPSHVIIIAQTNDWRSNIKCADPSIHLVLTQLHSHVQPLVDLDKGSLAGIGQAVQL